MAPTWQSRSGEYDGVTTNGVAFMRPVGVFESGVSPGEWREVTVNGRVRNLREERSARTPGKEVGRGGVSGLVWSVCLPAYLPACLPTCLPACLPACLPVCLSFLVYQLFKEFSSDVLCVCLC